MFKNSFNNLSSETYTTLSISTRLTISQNKKDGIRPNLVSAEKPCLVVHWEDK